MAQTKKKNYQPLLGCRKLYEFAKLRFCSTLRVYIEGREAHIDMRFAPFFNPTLPLYHRMYGKKGTPSNFCLCDPQGGHVLNSYL
jgi:hypothetical protein